MRAGPGLSSPKRSAASEALALFLLASGFPDGAPPARGKVEVGPNQSEDVFLVPRAPGTYKFECTHFLHSLFNMTGSIVVE
jgi:plastocyanin